MFAAGCGPKGPSPTPELTTSPNDPSQDDDDDDGPGHASQPCDEGLCRGDLVCVDDSCIDPATPPTSGPTSGANTSTDSTTSPPDPTATSATDPSGDPSSDPSTDPTVDPTGDDDLKVCTERCVSDSDCTINGMDIDFICEDSRCTGDPCADDDDCVATFSGWITDCAQQADCPGQVCIDIGGGIGKCATPPSDFIMCETILQQEVQRPLIEGGMSVVVCATLDYECHPDLHLCTNPCESDADCNEYVGYPLCNAATGICECTSDSDCQLAGSGLTACQGGVCGCADDNECFNLNNSDTCYDGVCGCADDGVCDFKTFDGTDLACQTP